MSNMTRILPCRAGQDQIGGCRRRTRETGRFANIDGCGADDQRAVAAIPRLLLVVVAIGLGVLWIVLAGLAPGHLRRRQGAWALHRASRLLLRALGVRIAQRSGPRSGASLVVVANGMSWLDVLVVSAAGPVLPVADVEVAEWPLIGSLARRSGAIFVDHKRLGGLPSEVEQIAAALRRGHRVLVFPAVGDQRESVVNPFRRAAFQAAVDAAAVVSPVVVTYRGSSGRPLTPAAPVDRATLVASLIRISAHRVTAEVGWLPTIPAIVDGGHPAGDRARAAAAAERAIARALRQRAVGGKCSPLADGQLGHSKCGPASPTAATESMGVQSPTLSTTQANQLGPVDVL
jgi:1-acyl-sn-glycerol-3-phosphate acyltransferase